MPHFECLYYLENFYLSIVEVKRLDVAADAPAQERLRWLRIELDSLAVSPLQFSSMDSAGEIQERFFEEGFLKFNNEIGTYIEKYNVTQHPLTNKTSSNLPENIKTAIASFLAQNKPQT